MGCPAARAPGRGDGGVGLKSTAKARLVRHQWMKFAGWHRLEAVTPDPLTKA